MPTVSFTTGSGTSRKRPAGREGEHLSLCCALEEVQPFERLRHGLADDQHAVIAIISTDFVPSARANRSPSVWSKARPL